MLLLPRCRNATHAAGAMQAGKAFYGDPEAARTRVSVSRCSSHAIGIPFTSLSSDSPLGSRPAHDGLDDVRRQTGTPEDSAHVATVHAQCFREVGYRSVAARVMAWLPAKRRSVPGRYEQTPAGWRTQAAPRRFSYR